MLDVAALLAPISDDAPCGADLEYDPVFHALQVAGEGKPDQQYGDTVIPAVPPQWPEVYEHATDLARRTRDLRVALWLARSGARLHGVAGAVQGLTLLRGLLENHWDRVHPVIDGGDPIMRLNALAPLTPQEEPFPGPPPLLVDLRAAALAHERGSLTVRELELGMGAAEALPGEATPTEAGVLEALRGLISRHADLPATMVAGHEAAEAVQNLLNERLGVAASPDLTEVRKLLATIARAARAASGETAGDAGGEAGAAGASGAARAAAIPGAINNRDDVVRTLDRMIEWIERNEPTNPVPLLLKRAKRLMHKNFMDIIRDIAPDGEDQVRRLAGREDEE
jgi:type VI secretion system protein ImpA